MIGWLSAMLVSTTAYMIPTVRQSRFVQNRGAMISMDEKKTIKVGTALPDVEVRVVVDAAASFVNITDLVGHGTSVLIGMPGAFTPSCTNIHLPGFYASMEAFAKLNVTKIGVCTANDRFVNSAWETSCNFTNPDSDFIQVMSDPRGDLAESLGLIAYLGKELGVRSKRFALLLEDGVVQHVAVDEGVTGRPTASSQLPFRTP